jgi:hypothetical protein
VDQWVEELRTLTLEYGMDSSMLMEHDRDQVRRFAAEIVPRVRAQVVQHRARTQHEGN